MISKIENTRINLQYLVGTIDVNGNLFKEEKHNALSCLRTHYEENFKTPTIGLMAEKRDIADIKKENPKHFKMHLKELLENPRIASMKKEFEQNFETMYY